MNINKKIKIKLLAFLIITTLTSSTFGQIIHDQKFSGFVPKGFVIVDTLSGDLNKDGLVDYILMIKGTDTGKFVNDEYRGRLDRNRRGIIVLFKNNNDCTLAVKNEHCFSSENEDGGNYYAPELGLEIKKGNLLVHYAHGRYGYWNYIFRYQHSDFELIGYDALEGGAVENRITSINFSTKIKIEKENTNPNAVGGDEVFKTTTKKISVNKLIRLSEIKDFDEMDMYKY